MIKKIYHYDGTTVLWQGEATDTRDAVQKATSQGANLRGADLRGADLRGANLRGADLYGAYLYGAYLYGADLYGADLYGADLRGANLRGADLRGADLRGANLRGADLYGADLYGADLRGAKCMSRERFMPLLMLHDQPGPIRAYKLVDAEGRSPIHTSSPLTYEIGKAISASANTDVETDCGAGINVATLDWCLANWQQGWRVFIVEFTAADIAAIPTGTDGKFRVHRCTVVAEKDITQFTTQTEDTKAAA